ncbi:MAG: DUF1015 family protein [Phycisphaerae bacterium]|nr:DUF1015 domain-containing protein [Phycisphaerae bacterium]NIP55995.1 DUF1015 domain-containing protein [Phycisphaerae bacterium]NIS54560.1 DUF1015 domain-containing protein [Phycisphaerae bacterium]NIU12196.1 DUF1015 domain-containing protein [Phycisphaerae bacterium]NIU58263.1 DUF1015 family protein [Phycisphaerae bacterium]
MEVKPFKAFRYDPGVVGDVGNCISPPYDVISPDQQKQLYEKSKYNIVRIIKGKTTSFDNEDNNQYTRAADYLKTWIDKGVLQKDQTDTIYAYVQDFDVAGNHFQRSSFIALARLEEFGKIVKPHEQTLDEPKVDRLNLKRATVAKFGLVFMLYEDKQKIADEIVKQAATQEPLVDYSDEQDVRHRLFAITSKDSINVITEMMADKSCIIADGHHRYETALNYYRETRNPAAGYQMTAFVNTRNEGLTILATHRLVGNLDNFELDKLIVALEENFEITEFEFDSSQTKIEAKQKMLGRMKAEHDEDKNALGIYGGSNAFYTAVLKDKQVMDSVASNMSSGWKSLNVSVLHKLVLEKLLGIGEKELARGGNVEYIKDAGSAVDESIAKVDTGEKQVAFLVNPPKMVQLKMVTDVGEKMPQKSTYFYPKVYTGLTINKL